MTNGIISESDWDNGTAGANNSEKKNKVLEYLSGLEKGAAAPMKTIGEQTGLKWPYSTVTKMVSDKVLEVRKIGKKNFFRVKASK